MTDTVGGALLSVGRPASGVGGAGGRLPVVRRTGRTSAAGQCPPSGRGARGGRGVYGGCLGHPSRPLRGLLPRGTRATEQAEAWTLACLGRTRASLVVWSHWSGSGGSGCSHGGLASTSCIRAWPGGGGDGGEDGGGGGDGGEDGGGGVARGVQRVRQAPAGARGQLAGSFCAER